MLFHEIFPPIAPPLRFKVSVDQAELDYAEAFAIVKDHPLYPRDHLRVKPFSVKSFNEIFKKRDIVIMRSL